MRCIRAARTVACQCSSQAQVRVFARYKPMNAALAMWYSELLLKLGFRKLPDELRVVEERWPDSRTVKADTTNGPLGRCDYEDQLGGLQFGRRQRGP